LNLSETAFLVPLNNQPTEKARDFSLRWFTPLKEVPLCGHATLASTHVLFTEFQNQNKEIQFHTKSGILQVQKETKGYLISFPQNPSNVIPIPNRLCESLGISNSSVIVCEYSDSLQTLLVELVNPQMVASLQPNFSMLQSIQIPKPLSGLIVTAQAEPTQTCDFVSRFFSPWLGINEDPVTGSAHTVLGPYWAAKLKKTHLSAFQCSYRGGTLELELESEQRIHLKGQARSAFFATISIPDI
jgi:PhzF family phenazine biosynthesis protein